MTTISGNIKFNNSTGSDTQASGCGPTTAQFGTTGTCTSGSAVVTGITTTGVSAGDLFWGQTSSGRQFSVIASVDSGTQVTLDDNLAANHSGTLTWAIGGKRSTINNADSRLLFSADLKTNWTIEFQYTGSNYTISSTPISIIGSVSLTLTSSGGTVVIEQTANDIHFQPPNSGSGSYTQFIGPIQFINSNATKTNAFAFFIGDSTYAFFKDCIFGSDVSGERLASAIVQWSFTSEAPIISFHNCQIINTTTHGIISSIRQIYLEMYNCHIRDCGGRGINSDSNGAGGLRIINCIVENCTSDGIYLDVDNIGRDINIVGCTINGNGGDGIDLTNQSFVRLTCIKNNITNNGGYGLNMYSGAGYFNQEDYNNFYNNTSGDRNNISAGAHDISVDPQYVNAANSNFTPQNDVTLIEIVNPSGVSSFEWIGAIQPTESGGSGSLKYGMLTGGKM